jgi:hypothetical protein
MSSDDIWKLALLIIGPTGALAFIFNRLMASCDQCCKERDEYRKVNDTALAAYRKRDEELAAWQLKGGPGRKP